MNGKVATKGATFNITSLASLPLDIFMILINSSSTLVITKTNEKKQKNYKQE